MRTKKDCSQCHYNVPTDRPEWLKYRKRGNCTMCRTYHVNFWKTEGAKSEKENEKEK